MKIKDKLLFIILSLSIIPAITVSFIFYIIGIEILREQIKVAHYEVVSAVDTLIFVVVSDMVNIAFTLSSKVANLIEREDYQSLREELNTIDQMNLPNIGTGRGLGYQIAIVTDKNGNILARSNIVKGIETEVAQRGHILYLDEEKTQKWNYPENFGIAFNNALRGNLDARKIIYNQEFLKREGYKHLIDEYKFNEMMGLTAFQPIFNEKNEQVGIIIIITILNNNHSAIEAINTITGSEFIAITPAGEIITSFFVNPPIPDSEIIEKAKKRADEIVREIKDARGKDTVFYTKERINLKICPTGGVIIFRGENIGTCYFNGQVIPFKELEERTYRLNFISEVDPSLKYVSIRGIAYDLTDHDYLITLQTRYFLIAFLITILVILLISLIAAKKITSPIIKCTKEIQKIEKQGFGEKIDIKTGDEIETLAKAFNEMSEKLAQSYKEIEEQKDVLEIRIEAKTKELKEFANNLDEQVRQKTKDLQGRIDELEKFRKVTIDREMKMIELKKEIVELKEKLQQYERRTY
jgi:HAMP domain-containing protein